MVKLNMQRQQNLTKNQKIVLDIIEKSTEPLKAYSILSNVKKKGINAPPQDRKSTRLNSSHSQQSRMPSSA